MRPTAVHWIDKNLGRPLCFFLTFHRRVMGILGRETADDKVVSKILFLKLVEQGSTVLAYGALKKAADMVGKENVFFMVFKENRFILDILDVVPQQNVMEVDSENFMKFVISVTKAIHRTRAEGIDAVIDLEFFSRASAILSYVSGASKRVGLHLFSCEGPYRGDLFNYRLLYNPYLHTSQLFLSLVEALKHKPDRNCPMSFAVPESGTALPQFVPSSNEKETLMRKIESSARGELGSPVVILNPNASDLLPIRKWPEENFVMLGKMVIEKYPDATLFITGTPEEKAAAESMALKIGKACSLAGRTTLRELLTLYCISDLLVTNDSGPAHFSTLTPIKSIILFGPETPYLYGPRVHVAKALASDLICSPCVNVYNHRKSPCREGHCMKGILPSEVFAQIKHFLGV